MTIIVIFFYRLFLHKSASQIKKTNNQIGLKITHSPNHPHTAEDEFQHLKKKTPQKQLQDVVNIKGKQLLHCSAPKPSPPS